MRTMDATDLPDGLAPAVARWLEADTPATTEVRWLKAPVDVWGWSPSDARFAVAPTDAAREVVCLDADRGTTLARFAAPGVVRELFWRSDDELWVIARGADAKLVLACVAVPEGEVLQTVALPLDAGGGFLGVTASGAGDGRVVLLEARWAERAPTALVLLADGPGARVWSWPALFEGRSHHHALHPDGAWLAAVSRDGDAAVWDIDAVDYALPPTKLGVCGELRWVGRDRLACWNEARVALLDVARGRVAWTHAAEATESWGGRFRSLSVHPEGTHLLCPELRTYYGKAFDGLGSEAGRVWSIDAASGEREDVATVDGRYLKLGDGAFDAAWDDPPSGVVVINGSEDCADEFESATVLEVNRFSERFGSEEPVTVAGAPFGGEVSFLPTPRRSWLALAGGDEGGLQLGLFPLGAREARR